MPGMAHPTSSRPRPVCHERPRASGGSSHHTSSTRHSSTSHPSSHTHPVYHRNSWRGANALGGHHWNGEAEPEPPELERGGGGFGSGPVISQPEYFPTGLLAVHTFGEDGPRGSTETIVVEPALHTLPQVLVGLYSQEEWTDFIRRIDEVFTSTHRPIFPCILTICGMSACRLPRREKLTEVIFNENRLRLLAQGLEWVQCQPTACANTRFMVLRINLYERKIYEAKNSGARKLTQEPIAAEFLPPPAPVPEPPPGTPSPLEMQVIIAQQELRLKHQLEQQHQQQPQQTGGGSVHLAHQSSSPAGPGSQVMVEDTRTRSGSPATGTWASPPASSAPHHQIMMESHHMAPPPLLHQDSADLSSTTISEANHLAEGIDHLPLPKFCQQCGTKYEGGKFCVGCGTRFDYPR